jgi:hypothetical protein
MPRKRIAVRMPLLQTYVVERLAYIDSVYVRTTKKIDPVDLKRLKSTLTPDIRLAAERYRGDPWRYQNPITGAWFYHYVHTIHQPTKATIQVLQDIQDQSPEILHLLQVDFALDLTTDNDLDAARLHLAFLGVLTPARLGKSIHKPEFKTSYMGAWGSGNEVVVYSDGRRKVRPQSPRVHIEWRIHGAKALERAKIKSAIDLVAVNHRAIWEKRLRLHIMPTLTRLLRILECRAARNGRPMNPEQMKRTRHLLERMSTDYNGRYFAQGLDDFLVHGLHPKPAQLYKRISNKWALPEPSNALWDEE